MNLTFYLFVSGVKKEMREGGESKISLCYLRGLGACPVFLRARWRNLVRGVLVND